jgi:hypothetical protein
MNRQEARYLAAMQAYSKGTPMLSDAEFDELKRDLKEQGSKFAVSRQPKCLIDTGVCTVTLQEDKFRSNLLYVPALAILISIWLGPSLKSWPLRPSDSIHSSSYWSGRIRFSFLSKFITEELVIPPTFHCLRPLS